MFMHMSIEIESTSMESFLVIELHNSRNQLSFATLKYNVKYFVSKRTF